MKRFTKNEFFLEKNPTIINFPIDNLQIKNTNYKLQMNIIHEGKGYKEAEDTANELLVDSSIKKKKNTQNDKKGVLEGAYRIQIRKQSTNPALEQDEWLEIEDLSVKPIMPQQVQVSEAYMLIY